MEIKGKTYDILKFLISFVPYIVTIVSGLLLAFGVTDKISTIVTLCIGSVGSIADAFIKAASKAHWKKVAEDGTEEDIDDAEDDDEEDEES